MFGSAMTFDWDADVSEEETDRLLQKMAESIVGRGMETPALWMLEIHKPLMPILGQFTIMGSPFIATFFAGGAQDLQKYTKLMQRPANVDSLINRIDTLAREVKNGIRLH
jgi:hypothetical protein